MRALQPSYLRAFLLMLFIIVFSTHFGYAQTGIITTVAGGGFPPDSLGDGIAATSASLGIPSDVAVGPDGIVYIADTSNNRVRKVDPQGIISTVAGTGPPGVSGEFGGDGGPATSAFLDSPSGVALGLDGSLFIADSFNGRIRKVDPQGIITTVAGADDAFFFNAGRDGIPATSAGLGLPTGVAIGPNGSLYIADTLLHCIYKVNALAVITTVAGSCGNRGGFSGDGGPATSAALNTPSGVAISPDGSLFIADTENRRIRKVNPQGIITTVAGSGSPGEIVSCSLGHCFFGDGGPATSARLGFPEGVAIGSDGSLFIADTENHLIRKVATEGIITTVAGSVPSVSSGSSGDGGPATSAHLNKPSGVAIGPDGSLFIADLLNGRIRKVTFGLLTTGIITGAVTNASTSTAIRGATVTTSPATSTATTDASGNYTFSNVPAALYTVTATASGFQSNSTTVTVSAGLTTTAALPLTPTVTITTGTITGRVTNASTSAAISGATVTSSPATSTVTTDASGVYTIINVAAGSYTLTVTASGFQSNSTSVTVSAGGTPTANMSLTSTLTGITLSPSTSTKTSAGATQQLTASPVPSDASLGAVTYTSSDPSVATVSNTGLVTAVASGTATITATSGSASGLATVTVSIARPPQILLSDTSFDFGSVEVGEEAERTLRVTNTGGGTLEGSVGGAAPPFTVVNGSYSLAGGLAQSVTVACSPTSTGAFTATLTFSGGGGASVEVRCNGTPLPVSPEVAPSRLDFRVVEIGQTATRTVTVTNVGATTLTGSVSGAEPPFTVSPASYTLGANQLEEITVTFRPLSASSFEATLGFSGTAGPATATLSVTGEGEGAACPVRGTVRARPQVIAAGIDPMIIDLGDTSLKFLAIVRPGAEPIRSVTFSENQGPFSFSLRPWHTLTNCDVLYAAEFSVARGQFGRMTIAQAFGSKPGQFQFRVIDEGAERHAFPDIEFANAPVLRQTVTSQVFIDETPGIRRVGPQVLAAGIDPIIIDTFNDTELEFFALVRPGSLPIETVTFSQNAGRFRFTLNFDEELPNGDLIYRAQFVFERFTFGEQVLPAFFGPAPGQFQFTATDEAQRSHSFPDFISGDFPEIEP